MADITTTWSGTAGDWTMAGADLASGADLATAVLISIFSDAAAGPDDIIPDGSADPRGWWADAYADKPIGSRLWLRARSKATPAVLAKIRGDVALAVKWLIDDGVAARIDVEAAWEGPGFVGVTVNLYQADGSRFAALKFGWAWQGVS